MLQKNYRNIFVNERQRGAAMVKLCCEINDRINKYT